MKVIVNREAFASAVKSAAHVARSNPRVPVLGCVRVSYEGGRVLSIEATDLDVSIYHLAEAEGAGRGAFVVTAGKLLEVTESAPEASIRLELAERALHIASGGARYKVLVDQAENFPSLPFRDLAGDPEWTCSSLDLAWLVSTVYPVVAGATGKFSRFGFAELLASEPRLKANATDGFRALQVSVPCPTAGEHRVRVHREALRALADLCAGEQECQVAVRSTPSHALFTVAGLSSIAVRFPEGDLPDFASVFAGSEGGEATVVQFPAPTMREALARVALCEPKGGVEFCSTDDLERRLTMRARGEVAEAEEAYEPYTCEGGPFSRNLSPRLLDPLIAAAQGVSGRVLIRFPHDFKVPAFVHPVVAEGSAPKYWAQAVIASTKV